MKPEDVKIGDTVRINPHGEGHIHRGVVTKLAEGRYGWFVEADMWVAESGRNKVDGRVGMPLCSIIEVLSS